MQHTAMAAVEIPTLDDVMSTRSRSSRGDRRSSGQQQHK